MERIQFINPQRIKWCCDDHGITPGKLASTIGIAPTSFEKLIEGEGGITFNQLKKIADHFNRGVLFFMDPEPVNEQRVRTPQFRTLTNQKPDLSATVKALIERVEKQRDLYISLCEDLDTDDQRQFSPPNLPNQNLKQAAAITRKWLELSEINTFDSYRQAVENRGMLVFRSNGYKGPWQIPKESPICGFSLYQASCPVIMIKKQAHESRQVFTLMHELGHVLLHQNSFMDEEDDFYSYQGKERDANTFAGMLLVPDVFLTQINDGQRPEKVADYDEWLRRYRKAWGVSGEVILRRLLDSGRLAKKQYDTYRSWIAQHRFTELTGGTRQYRHREPKHVFGEPFVRTVLDALSARYISLAKASTYLDNLKIKDVHKLESHCAGV